MVTVHMEYNNMVIGDSIRELRKAHHMTQMELAEKLDISFTHCSQLEQGRHKMSVDLLFRMMTLFQVDANTILGIKETEEERNAKLFSGIQDKIDGLEPKQREQFLNSCKLMLDGFSARKESMVRIVKEHGYRVFSVDEGELGLNLYQHTVNTSAEEASYG